MADLTVKTPPPSTFKRTGEEFTQETWNAAANGGVNLVPASAGKVGVIDSITISASAALNVTIENGTDSLVEPIYMAANSTVTLEGPIRNGLVSTGLANVPGDAENTVIDITASAADVITVFYRWHYETVTPT